VLKAKTQMGTGCEFPAALAVGEYVLATAPFGACGRDESFLDVTAGISMVELEFAIVEFMISSLRGTHPHGRWIVLKTKELREEHFVSS